MMTQKNRMASRPRTVIQVRDLKNDPRSGEFINVALNPRYGQDLQGRTETLLSDPFFQRLSMRRKYQDVNVRAMFDVPDALSDNWWNSRSHEADGNDRDKLILEYCERHMPRDGAAHRTRSDDSEPKASSKRKKKKKAVKGKAQRSANVLVHSEAQTTQSHRKPDLPAAAKGQITRTRVQTQRRKREKSFKNPEVVGKGSRSVKNDGNVGSELDRQSQLLVGQKKSTIADLLSIKRLLEQQLSGDAKMDRETKEKLIQSVMKLESTQSQDASEHEDERHDSEFNNGTDPDVMSSSEIAFQSNSSADTSYASRRQPLISSNRSHITPCNTKIQSVRTQTDQHGQGEADDDTAESMKGSLGTPTHSDIQELSTVETSQMRSTLTDNHSPYSPSNTMYQEQLPHTKYSSSSSQYKEVEQRWPLESSEETILLDTSTDEVMETSYVSESLGSSFDTDAFYQRYAQLEAYVRELDGDDYDSSDDESFVGEFYGDGTNDEDSNASDSYNENYTSIISDSTAEMSDLEKILEEQHRSLVKSGVITQGNISEAISMESSPDK